jgi:NACHT domain
MQNGKRSRPGPPARVDKKRHWGGSSPLKRSMRIFVYGGGLLLLGVLVWAVPAVLVRHSFSPDNRCQQRALSCSILASFLVPVLSLALVSAFFLLGRLWYLRRQYLHTARAKPQDMVPTAGSVIGDVVGRDELCRVMIADVRDTSTRRPHVVVGGIGTGKTALLVRLTKLLAHQRAVPVAIRLRDARERLDFGELAREKFIADLQSSILSDNEGEKVWRQLLKEGRVVVLADGLEEALIEGVAEAERDNVIRLAIRQANRNNLPLIIASRPHDPLRGTEATLVELEPLSEEAALDYIQRGDPADDEPRIDWIVETAEVTEAPLYLQVARQLHRSGLLTYPAANRDDRQLDTRNVDRSGMRLRLLQAWKEALVSGHFPPGVALSRDDRAATIEQLSVLACIGLRQDRLQVELDDFKDLWEQPSEPGSLRPIVREVCRRLGKSGHCSLDIKLAATWGAQLQLVEAQKNAVRFPHSILQAYLGSRLIAYAMADTDFRAEALKNAGRELLIALVLHSRATMKQDSPRGRAHTAIDSGGSFVESMDLPTLLLEEAGRHSDAKAFDLYATALEIDSVDTAPKHQVIATEIAAHWQMPVERDPRTLEHAKLNLVHRFGEAARAISARQSQTDDPVMPAYRQLFDIGCAESSYQVRLAVAQEIGAGGDDALAQLAGLLGPDPAYEGPAQADANGQAHRLVGQQSEREAGDTGAGPGREDDKQKEAAQQEIMRAWLVPLLVGSATSDERRATARGLLQCWLDSVHAQQRRTNRERFGLSLEIALAQGFKYAANRRRGHPRAPDEARAYLAEQTQEMLRECDFWFTRLTLLHALTLWHLPDGADQQSGRGRNPDYKTLVAHWCGMEDRRRDRFKEHPFVEQAMRLSVRALETRQPERYMWIDESGVVSRVGSCPTRPGRRPKHNLWIPPSTGWTALNARAQQLVADVLLLLNLAERGEHRVRDRDQRLQRTSKNYLPPCIAEDRSPLKPNRPLGMAGESTPGSSCTAECQFGLCPYPLKGAQHHRQELSEAFCRRQQRLLAPGTLRSSKAPWHELSQRRLRRFWRELGEPIPRAELEDDVGHGRRRDRRP